MRFQNRTLNVPACELFCCCILSPATMPCPEYPDQASGEERHVTDAGAKAHIFSFYLPPHALGTSICLCGREIRRIRIILYQAIKPWCGVDEGQGRHRKGRREQEQHA